MNPLPPVNAVPLFPAERAALLDVLASLTPEDWPRETSCPGWSLKDIVAHLLADDLGRLSGGRDRYAGTRFEPSGEQPIEAELLEFINQRNELWVEAAHRFSPRVLIELLRWSGAESQRYFESLDPDAPATIGVSWAGEAVSANWFDLARELTERWLHQQQIREAADVPALYDPAIFVPVLDTFVRALPHTFRDVDAPNGTHVSIMILAPQPAPDPWNLEYSLLRRGGAWELLQPIDAEADASVSMDGDTAWRVFTKGIAKAEAIALSSVDGDQDLAEKVFDTVSIIA
jgi:uncharacterized protein (TIGR03083 family)